MGRLFIVWCLCISVGLLMNASPSESRSHQLSKRETSDPPSGENASEEYNFEGADDSETGGYFNDGNNDGDNDDEDDEGADDEDDFSEVASVPPQIKSIPRNYTVKEGDSLLLPCDIENLGRYQVLWSKDVQPLYIGSLKANSNERINSYPNNKTLHITDLKKSDAGVYTCYVSNSKTNAIQYHIDFFAPPIIVKKLPLNNTVVENSSVVIECRATGNPEPTIKWSRDGHRVSDDDVEFKHHAIYIKNVKRKHSGMYQCLAENGQGEPSHGSVSIRVLFAPKVHLKQSVINTAEGYQAQLLCTVYSDPRSSIIWLKNNEIIPQYKEELGNNQVPNKFHIIEEEGGKHSKLTINDIKPSDFGKYYCNATNVFGTGIGHVTLVKVPGRALWIGGSQDSSESNPILQWTIESIQPITNLELKYLKLDETKPDHMQNGEWIIEQPKIEIPSEGNKYTVKHLIAGLKPGKYAVRLRAQNAHGWGELSDQHVFDGDYENSVDELIKASVGQVKSGSNPIRYSSSMAASVLISTFMMYSLVRIL